MKEKIIRQASFGENGNLKLENILAGLRGDKIIKELRTLGRLERVLDLGSGFRAEFLAKIVKLFPAVKKAVAIDLSVAAEAPDFKIELIASDLNLALPLTGDSFDAVTCAAAIEHLNDRRMVLSEARRVLRPGGYLLLTTPARRAKPILGFLKFMGLLDRTEIDDHKEYFTGAELRLMLNELGFSEVKIKTFQLGFNLLAAAKK